MILKKMQEEEINQDFLKNFERYSHTTKMLYVDHGVLKEKETNFEDHWDTKRLREISLYLKECRIRGGVVLAFYEEQQVIAFGNLEPKLYRGTTIHMPYIHVDRRARYKGIGQTLFKAIEKEALSLGGQYLYMSTHPDIHVQAFYDKVGSHLAENYIEEIHQHEPADIQRIKKIN